MASENALTLHDRDIPDDLDITFDVNPDGSLRIDAWNVAFDLSVTDSIRLVAWVAAALPAIDGLDRFRDLSETYTTGAISAQDYRDRAVAILAGATQ